MDFEKAVSLVGTVTDRFGRRPLRPSSSTQLLVVAVWALCGVAGCKDPAEPDLDRCLGNESRKDWTGAIEACDAAVSKSSTSDAGRLATGKLAVLREKLSAQKLWEKAESEAHEKDLARQVEARRIAAGGWKYLPRPTDADGRVKYMSDVTTAYEGEPPLDRNKALALMQKIRVELAKAAGVKASQVVAKVGTTAGALKVGDGVLARIGTSRADALDVGVCSEPFLGTALLGIEAADIARAGLRGLVCTSTACSAAFDLRPDRPDGGGVYGGAACISMADVIERAMHEAPPTPD
jgi:hypothetical protein